MAYDIPQVESLMKDISVRSEKAIEHMRSEFSSLRAGKANPKVLDKVFVDYYGASTPISQMANVSIPDPRTILISPWDKAALKQIEKAILAANLGLNPVTDGNVMRMTVPVVTEERRKELSKNVKKLSEECKVAVRNIRRDVIDGFKKLKTDKILSEDMVSTYEKDVDKIINKQMEVVEKLAKEKEQEVMSV